MAVNPVACVPPPQSDGETVEETRTYSRIFLTSAYAASWPAKGYTCIVYFAAHVLWIAQNAGGSSAVYQEVGSSRFELEHTNTGTYSCTHVARRVTVNAHLLHVYIHALMGSYH